MNRVSPFVVLKNGFREAFDLIPIDQQYAFILTISENLGWSKATFYNRMNGSRAVRRFEKDVLTQCFEAYGIDLWAVTKN